MAIRYGSYHFASGEEKLSKDIGNNNKNSKPWHQQSPESATNQEETLYRKKIAGNLINVVEL